MVFLCFSVKDREFAELIHNHLMDFGIDVWYDKKNIMLGDKRIYANINNGVKNNNIKYAVILYSKNFVNGKICVDEYDILLERYNQKNIELFPIFLEGDPVDIPEKYNLCKKLVFKAIKNPSIDFYTASLYILAKIIQDEISTCEIKNISQYIEIYNEDNSVVNQLLIDYDNVCKDNYNMRLGILYSLFIHVDFLTHTSYTHKKTMTFLFYRACNIPILSDNKEFYIMENIVLYYLHRIKFC